MLIISGKSEINRKTFIWGSKLKQFLAPVTKSALSLTSKIVGFEG
jgi:hypothetical protein